MPRRRKHNNHTQATILPQTIAQVNIADLLALELLGAKLHSYRDSRNNIRLYLSNIQDLKGKDLIGIRSITRDLITYHLAKEDQVVHLL